MEMQIYIRNRKCILGCRGSVRLSVLTSSKVSRISETRNLPEMLRAGIRALQSAKFVTGRAAVAGTSVRFAHHDTETADEFDARYEKFLNRPDIDGWELRKAMNDLQGHDLVPEPKIVIAAMKACRRVNDYALAVRYLEAVKDKCGPKAKEIWPFMVKEVGPTLKELGILTPEEMGYDKPELACKDVLDM